MTDIDHFQADVSAEGFLRQSYDICVGLSAFSFMQRNIDYICSQTSEQMIIETHEVEEGWYELYARPIVEHFPHWCCFARVPHSATDSSKWRLWLTFSKDQLMPFYRQRAVSLLPDAEGVVEIDLARSTLHFPTAAELILDRRHELLSPASIRLYADELAEYERRFEAGERVDVSMSGARLLAGPSLRTRSVRGRPRARGAQRLPALALARYCRGKGRSRAQAASRQPPRACERGSRHGWRR